MPDTEHTPGPWNICGDDRHEQPMITAATGALIAVCAHECVKPRGELRANARLIAAAPELAAALASALRWIGSLNDWAGADDPDLDAWRALLAKSRGKD